MSLRRLLGLVLVLLAFPAAAKDEPANPGSAGTSGDEATLSIGPD